MLIAMKCTQGLEEDGQKMRGLHDMDCHSFVEKKNFSTLYVKEKPTGKYIQCAEVLQIILGPCKPSKLSVGTN